MIARNRQFAGAATPRLMSALALGALFIAFGVLASSGAASVRGSDANGATAVLRVGMPIAATTLDPAVRLTAGSGAAISLGLDTLMKLTPDGRVVPNLARSVTRPGTAVYVYHLRKGVKFWNGNELTASDVANALNYYRFPKFGTSAFYTSVRDIRATDRYTVTVRLKHRDASWQYVPVIRGWIFEKKFADEHPGTLGSPSTLTMGTGPYKIDSFDPTNGIELSAHSKYWGGKVQTIQRISIKFFANETSEALALRAGEIDAVPILIGDSRGFAATSGVQVRTAPSCAQEFLSLNTQVAPWSDIHVRRAVAFAINRSDMIAAYGGPATALRTLIPPVQLTALASKVAVNKLIDSLPKYAFDLTKAKQELAKSKYPNGFSTSILSTNFGAIPTIVQAIAGALKKIDIAVDVKQVPVASWLAQYYGPRDQLGIWYSGTFGCTSPDPSWYPSNLLGSANARPNHGNAANYTQPKVDDLLKAGLVTNDPAKRFAAYAGILKQLAADVPYIPFFTENANYAISNKFSWSSYIPTFYYNHGRPWALNIKAK